MSLRDTPTAQDVIQILEAQRTDPLAAMISARWYDTIDLMTAAFGTTGSAAEDLLSRLVTADNGPLLAIRTPDHGPVERMVHAERDIGRAWRREWRTLDVPETVHTWLRLTHTAPTTAPSTTPNGSPDATSNGAVNSGGGCGTGCDSLDHSGCFWVLRRSSLRAICVTLTPADTRSTPSPHRGVDNSEPSARDTPEQAQFDEHHADDREVIAAFVDQSLPPDTEPWQRQHLLTSSMVPGFAELYGTGGQLTLTLRGDQISVFADRLRDAL